MPRRPSAALLAASIGLLAGCGGCGNGPHSAKSPGAPASTQVPAAPAVKAARGVKLKRIGNFSSPVFVTAPRGDTHRLFVVERDGRIRVVKDGRKLGTSFLNISS